MELRALVEEDNEARLQKQVEKIEQELVDIREQIIKEKDVEIQNYKKNLRD